MADGQVAAGAGLLAAILLALLFNWLAPLWEAVMENIFPVAFVTLAVLAAGGWGILGLNGADAEGSDIIRRRSSVGRGPARLGASQSEQEQQQQQQQQQQQERQHGQLRQRHLSMPRQLPHRMEGEQEVELVRLGSGGGSGGGSGSSASAAARAGGSASAGSSRGAGLSALVPLEDMSRALAETTSFSCPRPLGCGFRHACPDARRSWMHCDKHGYHPAPPAGSVWREVVPEGEERAGEMRLHLSWEGRVLDVTELGRCRGWDQQLTSEVGALLDRGRRVAGMCSQSSRFPRLQKFEEVAQMDYRAAARSRRLWSTFERWLGRNNPQGSKAVPLAIMAGHPAAPAAASGPAATPAAASAAASVDRAR